MGSSPLAALLAALTTTRCGSACITVVMLATTLFACPRADAEPLTQHAHTAWRVQEGALGASPLSITQTADGYLWIGTRAGLVRFDGVRFESWDDRVHETQACCAQSLLGASDGTLWIGTGSGLAKWKDGKLSSVTNGDARYNEIIEDRQGRIWLARSRIRDGKGPLCAIEGDRVVCHGSHDGLECQFGNTLIEDRGGTIWVGDAGRICSWKDGATAAYSVAPTDVGCKPTIESLLEDAEHSILIGCLDGVRRLEQGSLVPLRLGSIDDDKLQGAKLFHDRGGSLWLGTKDQGLYHVQGGVVDHFGAADGLTDDTVDSVYEDREGSVWVLTPKGIDRFHRLSVVSFSGSEGWRGLGASVLATRDGQAIWTAGTHGIAKVTDRKIAMVAVDALPGKLATALFEDARGVLWVGVDQDLYAYAQGRFTRKLRADGSSTGMVVGIAEDARRNLWIVTATKDRLLRLDPKEDVARVVAKADLANRIARTPSGVVYVLSSVAGRISIVRDGDVAEELALPSGARTGSSLLARDDESLLVATHRGLHRWAGRKWSVLATNNGLPCEAVQDLVDDGQGGLWLHLACGYVHLGKSQFEVWARDERARLDLRLYDAVDGAAAGRTDFEPSHARTTDGRFWFATGYTLQMIDPDHLPRNELVPPVHIVRMVADHQSVDTTAGAALPALTRDLEIHYAALSLVAPEKVRYRYRLSEIDRDWQDAGSRREAYYMGLPPGRYRFQVIAANNDGVWNQQGATLDFSIAPAYYQTNSFRALCALLLVALLWAAYQLRIRGLRRQFELALDARVAERTRIARDLHDTLLQSFHGLLLHLQTVFVLLPQRPEEAKDKLGGVIEQASEAIGEGREAVQALRESTVQRNDLALAIGLLGRELASDATEHGSANLAMAVHGDARDLHPIVRDDVYRIAAEALRNAFRHAHAGRIEVDVRYEDDRFELRVRDDGEGVDPVVLREGATGHYGLSGMRERASVIGAKLVLRSEPGSGTEVTLSLPASRAYVRKRRWWESRATEAA